MNKIHTDFHRVVNAIFNIMAIAFLLDVVYFWSVLVLFFSDNIYKIQHLFIFLLLTVFYRLQDIMLIGIHIFRIGLRSIHELEF